MSNTNVDHPQHYGRKDNPYEAIKVIEAWGLGFCLGNTVKYISRAGKKLRTAWDEETERRSHPDKATREVNQKIVEENNRQKKIEDLKKAVWYLNREIENLEKE